MCHSVKNYFSKPKSHSLNGAHDQKQFSRTKKNSSHGNFNQFRFEVKTPSEPIVLPVKRNKNLKKTNTTLRVVKTKRKPIIASAIASWLLNSEITLFSDFSNTLPTF